MTLYDMVSKQIIARASTSHTGFCNLFVNELETSGFDDSGAICVGCELIVWLIIIVMR